MKPGRQSLIPLALALLCTSCETLPPDSKTDKYVVSAEKAPFYKYGPAQAMGADFTLNQGQLVTMLKRSTGFSQIQTPGGDTGYVSNEDIAPAPEENLPRSRAYIAEPEPPPLPAVDPRPFEPPELLPEVPADARPRFRY